MPVIREYENKAGLRPEANPQTAVNAGNAKLQAARAEGAMFESLGQTAAQIGKTWEEQRVREEISQGYALEAQVTDNITEAWNNTIKNADPNDPQTAQKFRDDELEPLLQAYATGFKTTKGQQWAEARVATLRQHFYDKTIADQSRMAGVAAVSNLETTTNAMEATLQKDPTMLPLMLGTADSMVEGILQSNPHFTPDQVAKFRGELAPAIRKSMTLAAGRAMARTDPDAFQKAVAEGWGGSNIDGQDREQLFGFAATMKNAQEADARAAEAAHLRQQKMIGDANLTRAYAAGLSEDGTSWHAAPDLVSAITEDALRNPDRYSPGEVSSFVSAVQRSTDDDLNGTNTRTDPPTWDSLSRRIGHGLHKTEVDQAYAAKRLSKADWTFLRQAAEGQGSDQEAKIPGWGRVNEMINEHLSSIRSSITKSNPMAGEVSPLQDRRFGEYSNTLRRSILGAINRGATADEAADKYLNPNSANYFGKLVPYYQVPQETLDQAAFDGPGAVNLPPVDLGAIGRGASPTGAAVTPRKPGESAADYLRRTGGG